MEKIMYDDGSYTIVDDAGNMGAWDIYGLKQSVVSSAGQYFENPAYAQGQWAADQREAQKIAPFYPDNGLDWFKNVATYGAKAIIDSHYGPQAAVNKTQAGATFAGANGKTYGTGAGTIAGVSPLVAMALVGAVLFVALSD